MNDATVHPLKIRAEFHPRKPGRCGVTVVIPISSRQRLPSRRLHLGETTTYEGQKYHVGFGFDPNGKLREVFITTGKVGSAIEAHVQTQAILISLLLQHDVELTVIKHSISGVAAHALGLLSEDSCPSADAHDGRGTDHARLYLHKE
jgi:hypothetical protein